MKKSIIALFLMAAASISAHASDDIETQVSDYQKKIDAQLLKTPLGAFMNMAQAYGKFELLTGGIPKGQTAEETGLADANLAQARLEKELPDYLNKGATCKQVKDAVNWYNNDRFSQMIAKKRSPLLIKAKNNLVDAIALYALVSCEEVTK